MWLENVFIVMVFLAGAVYLVRWWQSRGEDINPPGPVKNVSVKVEVER